MHRVWRADSGPGQRHAPMAGGRFLDGCWNREVGPSIVVRVGMRRHRVSSCRELHGGGGGIEGRVARRERRVMVGESKPRRARRVVERVCHTSTCTRLMGLPGSESSCRLLSASPACRLRFLLILLTHTSSLYTITKLLPCPLQESCLEGQSRSLSPLHSSMHRTSYEAHPSGNF